MAFWQIHETILKKSLPIISKFVSVLSCFLKFLILLISVALPITSAIAADNGGAEPVYTVAETPQWVEPVATELEISDTPNGVRNGVYYLLVDRQKNLLSAEASTYQHFSRFRYEILNQNGLESYSSVDIDFDPSYQQLTVNQLIIWRDGVAQDRTTSANFKLLNRESERENLLYNGELTLDILLSDTRVGDVVEYSYTLTGSNPVFGSLWEHGFDLAWGIPVQQLFYRVLVPADTPVAQRQFASDQRFDLLQQGDRQEYRMARHSIAKEPNDDKPELVLSAVRDWQQVAKWAQPLYQHALEQSQGVAEVAAEIQRRHDSTEAQIGAALHWAQNSVRYFGVEYGTNSHNPSPAQETLRRRYGDCKDKAVLLIAILRELGIPAQPALVFSGEHVALDISPYRLHAFNHVIVHLMHDNKHHWIDPTLTHQKGALGQFSESEHGHALVIKAGSNNYLQAMNPTSRPGLVSVQKTITIDEQGEAKMQVVSERSMGEAESHRRSISRQGLSGLSENYLDYFKESIDDIRVAEKLVMEDRVDNTTLTTEHYQFGFDDEKDAHSYVSPDDIVSVLKGIRDTENGEENGYSIETPHLVNETLVVQYNQDINYSAEGSRVDNDYFYFSDQFLIDEEARTLTIKYSFRVKQKEIPAEDYAAVQQDAKTILNSLYLSLSEPLLKNQPKDLGVMAVFLKKWSGNISIGVYIAFALVYLYALVEWLLDRRRNRAKEKPETAFYPVSPKKFWLMGFVTFGLYLIYYFYCTFRYSRDSLAKRVWPGVRAVFSVFFLYSAYSHVREYAASQSARAPVAKAVVVLLAIAYFVLNILGSSAVPMLASILAIACVHPLIKTVNALNSNNTEAYKLHSKMRPRHILFCVLCPFLFLMTIPSELNILPSSAVVQGWQVWPHQKKFMVESHVLRSDEKLRYFYSDAIYDFRLDGNGLTDKHLFAYWGNEQGKLDYIELNLDEIVSIEAGNRSSEASLGTAWMKARTADDQELMVYLPDLDDCKANFIVAVRQSAAKNASFDCKA